MNPTSFFLLALLLVLVTEAAARRSRERFSQSSEENIDLKTLGGSGGSSDEYSRSESAWSTFSSKTPNAFSEEVYEERKHRHSSEGGNLDYKMRGGLQGEDMSSFKSRMKTRITGK